MLRVMRNHRRAAYGVAAVEYEGLSITPLGIDPAHCPAPLLQAARETWDRAVGLGEQHGYRNAQVTVLAPTGTIGLVMDCDTTGIEPDFSLVKFKKLAGGGYFKIINQSLPAGARDARLHRRPRSTTSWPTASAARRCGARRSSTTTRSAPRASTTRGCSGSKPRSRPRSTSPSPSTPGRSARATWPRGSASTRRSSPSGTATCSARSASPPPRSRRPTTTAAAP